MEIDQIIMEYRQWVANNPDVYKISYGSPSVYNILPVLSAFQDIATSIFGVTANVVVSKLSNQETLDGFSAWYKYVYVPAQP